MRGHPGTCPGTRYPETSKCWDGSGQGMRDDAGAEGRGRGWEEGGPRCLLLRGCAIHSTHRLKQWGQRIMRGT